MAAPLVGTLRALLRLSKTFRGVHFSVLFYFALGGYAAATPLNPISRTNRLDLAIMGFTDESDDPKTLSWQVGIDWSVFSDLKQINQVRILPTDNISGGRGLAAGSNDAAEVTTVARAIGADCVVWGSYIYSNQVWSVKGRTLNLANGGECAGFHVVSAKWDQVQQEIATDIFQALSIKPTDCQWRAMQRFWSVPAAALKAYDEAELLDREGGSVQQEMKYLQEAIKVAPSFAEAYGRLAQLSGVTGNAEAAEKLARTSIRMNPGLAETHNEYAVILFKQKKYNQAELQLRAAAGLDPDDAVTFERLGDVELLRGMEASAAEAYAKALDLDPYSSSRRYLQSHIDFCLPRAKATFFTNGLPNEYTDAELTEILRHSLTPNELGLVEDPLLANREMQSWAEAVTKGSTNGFEKARMLFEEIVQRVYSADTFLEPSNSLTAEEIFLKMKARDTPLNCEESTLLFVSLARAVGLRSFCVQVCRDYEGHRVLHACAAVYFGGKMLLVDPACFWFGVPHQKFMVLSDIEAIGIYLSTFPDLERRQIAAKLAPKTPLVLFNLCVKLVEKQPSQAKRLLPNLIKCDTNGALASCLEGDIALHEGPNARAIRLFQNAIAIEPEELFFMELARAYLSGGKLIEARVSLDEALKTNHTAEDEAEINKCFSVIDHVAENYYQFGKRDFDGGDLAGALTNFDAAIKIKPDFADAYASRGFVEQKRGNFGPARADYTKAIVINPDWAEVYEYRGFLEQQCSNLDAALADYSRAIDLKPHLAEAYGYRAELERLNGDLNGAETDVEEAAKFKSTNAAWEFYFLGWSRYERQEYTNALSDFCRACELNATDEYSPLGVWVSGSRLGETGAATQELKEYLTSRGNFDDWPCKIGLFLTNQMTEKDLLAAADDADSKRDHEQLSEAYFYIGCKRLIAGDKAGAAAFFEKCVATGVQNSSEYHCAKVELNNLQGSN